MGMVELLEWVRLYQPQARLVSVSTDEVFGHLGEFDPPFDERTRFDPRSPYAASKASADLIANSYVTTYGLDIVTTHCCNNFGKHQADEKFIPTVVRHMVENKPIPVYGTGKNIREWIHVNDHNKSLLEIAEMGKSGRRYNIGSKIDKDNLEMIVDIGEVYGKRMPNIEFVEDRKGHDFRYAIDSLYYKRQFKLRNHMDALKETVEFYKNKYENI
jgi:dTDP-glucose 4,6-dehydratase